MFGCVAVHDLDEAARQLQERIIAPSSVYNVANLCIWHRAGCLPHVDRATRPICRVASS